MARNLTSILRVLLIAIFILHVSALFCGKENCFEILGIQRNASKGEVRRAYRRLSAEKHPDKRPGDEEALDEFRRIGTAYETLTDDAKRAKYEDYLDNPGKYLKYLIENAKEVYAPKSNVFLVITGIIGIATLIHWLNMNHTYKQTLLKLKETQEFKREVARLIKSRKAATKEEAEGMINLDVVGLEEPNWRNLVVFKMIAFPGHFAKLAMWNVNWFIKYKIKKREYSDEDKAYLIRKNLKFSEKEWEKLSEKDKELYMKEEVWDTEKCEDFMFRKRIEMNRLGKSKKKKKHTSIPYSEAEEVSF